LAKISEYSDSQIDKLFAKYQKEAKKDPSDKNKKILVQLKNEKKKRIKTTQESAQKSSSDLSQLISKASAVNKSKRAVQKKKDSRMSQRLRKTEAPMISKAKANIMFSLAFIFGAIGIVMIADYLLFSWIPIYKHKLTIGIVLIVPACICAKVATYLSDDNR
jgi:hypothetical protein